MSEIDKIRSEIRDEIMEGILKQVVKSLTPKELEVLDRLTLSDDEIAKALHCRPKGIPQVTHIIYGKFSITGIFDPQGTNKRGTMIAAWREIRDRYPEFLPASQQEK